jgi:hypothetical protein
MAAVFNHMSLGTSDSWSSQPVNSTAGWATFLQRYTLAVQSVPPPKAALASACGKLQRPSPIRSSLSVFSNQVGYGYVSSRIQAVAVDTNTK